MDTDEDTVVSGLPVRFTCSSVYSEHGFLLLQAGEDDDDGYWQVDEPGVYAGAGWLRVGGGVAGVYVELDLLIRSASGADGSGPASDAPILTVTEYPINVADPVSTFGLMWPVDPGLYEVRVDVKDAPSPNGVLPAQKWQVELIGWPTA